MIRWKDRTSIVRRWQQYPDIAKKLSAECQNRTFTVAWKIQVECSDVISIKADFPSSSRWENRRVCGTYTAGDINVCRSTRCNVVFLLFLFFLVLLLLLWRTLFLMYFLPVSNFVPLYPAVKIFFTIFCILYIALPSCGTKKHHSTSSNWTDLRYYQLLSWIQKVFY